MDGTGLTPGKGSVLDFVERVLFPAVGEDRGIAGTGAGREQSRVRTSGNVNGAVVVRSQDFLKHPLRLFGVQQASGNEGDLDRALHVFEEFPQSPLVFPAFSDLRRAEQDHFLRLKHQGRQHIVNGTQIKQLNQCLHFFYTLSIFILCSGSQPVLSHFSSVSA